MDNLTDDQRKMQRRSVAFLRLEADIVLESLRQYAAQVRFRRDSAVASESVRMDAARTLRTIEEIEDKVERSFVR